MLYFSLGEDGRIHHANQLGGA